MYATEGETDRRTDKSNAYCPLPYGRGITSDVRNSKPRSAPHCRVLPPGEYDDMILEPIVRLMSKFMTLVVTVLADRYYVTFGYCHRNSVCCLSSACITSMHSNNKCIGDDTKAAARQSLNCIKNKKIKYGEKEKRFSIWRMEFLHPAMWHVAPEL